MLDLLIFYYRLNYNTATCTTILYLLLLVVVLINSNISSFDDHSEGKENSVPTWARNTIFKNTRNSTASAAKKKMMVA